MPLASGAGPAALVLYRRQDTAQDVDFVAIERGALEQPAQARHEMGAALGAVAEVDLVQHLSQVLVEPLHFLGSCERGVRVVPRAVRGGRLPGPHLRLRAPPGEEELVSD